MKAGSHSQGGRTETRMQYRNILQKIFGIKKTFCFWPAAWTWWAGWWRPGRPWRGQRWGLARSWPRTRWRACSRARRLSAGSRRTPAWRWGPPWGSCTRLSTICCPDLFYGFPVYFQGFMFFLQQQLAAGLGPGVSGVLSRPDQRRFCGGKVESLTQSDPQK